MQEIRDIYAAKGFEGELLEQVVEVITADKDRWVDVMMKEELFMMEETKSPFKMGLVTYIAFILIGLIPLSTYAWDFVRPIDGNIFLITSILTGLGFMLIGFLKTYVTETSIWKGVLETLALGAIAAIVSYFVGDILEHLITRS